MIKKERTSEAPKTISKFAFSCEPVWSMYRAQTGFYQAHRETSNEAQLALIKVFLLYIFQTGSHENANFEIVLGASIAHFFQNNANNNVDCFRRSN